YGGGGTSNGTLFQMTTGGSMSLLASFNGTNGAQPESTPLIGRDGSLYGTTSQGGTVLRGGKRQDGTVYNYSDGALSTLVAFDYTNGGAPDADLTQGQDGSFYGAAAQGGSSGFGTIFNVTTNGDWTTLWTFN